MLNMTPPPSHSKCRASASVSEGGPMRREHSVTRRALFALAGLGLMGGGLSATQAFAAEAEAYVSAFTVREQTDGVGPFDADDEPGNDSGADNRVVRSFDQVDYLLEYTTELTDKTHPVTDTVTLKASFELAMDPLKARFNDEAMSWAKNASVTYYYADGTSSAEWDRSRTVTRQVYMADRLLEGKGADDRAPGAGQLSVGIRVYAAVQGDVIRPTFRLHVDGDSRERSCQPEAVRVSSYPRFNTDIKQGYEASRNIRYADWDAGTVALSDDTGKLDRGRVYGNSIALAMRNTSSSKGLKGLELPQGPITFDVRLTATLDEQDATHDDEWGVFLWDYFENVSTSRGHLGRSMKFEAATTMPNWGAPHPTNRYGLSKYHLRVGCFDGGSWTVEQDEAESNLLHVTVSNYAIDTDEFLFPETTYNSQSSTPTVAANIAYVTCGVLQIFARFPREVDGTRNYRVCCAIENLRVESASGTVATEQQVTTDDAITNAVTLYAPGTITKYVQFNNNPYWSSGAAWCALGGTTVVHNQISYAGTRPIYALDQLSKFDTHALSPVSASAGKIANAAEQGTSTIWWAAKPDGIGWASDLEMDDTRVEQLVYYRSLDELRAADKVCVGVLRELRDAECYAVRDDFLLDISFKVLADVDPGYVAQATSDVRAWNVEGSKAGSVGDFDRGDGSFGIGDPSWEERTYPKGYDKPYADIFYRYYKTEYEGGQIVGGHTGGAVYGDSTLVVGARARITIEVADELSSGERKQVYDLDANERTARWTVTPAVDKASANAGASQDGSQPTGSATVVVRIPADLTYVAGSCTLPVTSVVVNEVTGETAITVEYPSVTAGEQMEPFDFETTIGAAGTDHDVDNNQQITATAEITSTLDARRVDASNGNLSEASIKVVRLAAISVFKSVTPAYANPDDAHAWTLRFGNSSETDVTDAALVDMMPYSGDDRGSDFSGTYAVTRIALDLVAAPKLFSELTADGGMRLSELLWLTGDEVARELGDDAMLADDSAPARSWAPAPDVAGSTLTWDFEVDLEDIVAWGLVIGTMHGQEYLTVKLDIKPEGAKSGDVYVNSFTENAHGQAAIVHSNVVRHEVEDVSVMVRKVWDGVNGHTGTPDVTVTVIGSDDSEHGLALTEDNGFSAATERLPRYQGDGNRITYTVEERDVPEGYELSGIEGDDVHGFTVTNRALTGDANLRKEPRDDTWI